MVGRVAIDGRVEFGFADAVVEEVFAFVVLAVKGQLIGERCLQRTFFIRLGIGVEGSAFIKLSIYVEIEAIGPFFIRKPAEEYSSSSSGIG